MVAEAIFYGDAGDDQFGDRRGSHVGCQLETEVANSMLMLTYATAALTVYYTAKKACRFEERIV